MKYDRFFDVCTHFEGGSFGTRFASARASCGYGTLGCIDGQFWQTHSLPCKHCHCVELKSLTHHQQNKQRIDLATLTERNRQLEEQLERSTAQGLELQRQCARTLMHAQRAHYREACRK